MCQLADLPRHLDAGRAGADHNECPSSSLLWVITELSELERSEDPTTQLQGIVDALHPGSELGELIIAEIRLTRTSGHDQAVVRGDGGAEWADRGDRLGFDVDIGDSTEQHRRVLLVLEHLTGRRRNFAFGQHAGRDLVEQRLEQVV